MCRDTHELLGSYFQDLFWESFERSFRNPCTISGEYGIVMEGVYSSAGSAAASFTRWTGRVYSSDMLEQRSLYPCFPGAELFTAVLNHQPLSSSLVRWRICGSGVSSPFFVWYVYN